MKRKIFTLVFLLAAFVSQAQNLDFYTFDGSNYTICDSLPITTNPEDAASAANDWMLLFSDNNISENELGDTFTTSGEIQVGSAYNPFAGSYSYFLGYRLNIVISKEYVTYKMENMTFTRKYTGYGTSNKKYSLSQVINTVKNKDQKISEINASTTMSKKEKKKAIKELEADVESFTKSLNKIEKTVNEKIAELQQNI